jgi:hypothetical protein
MSSEFDNKLKSISIHQLETAIAKAINELIGEDYECSISNLSFTNIFDASFEAKVYKPLNTDWLNKPKKEASES